MSHPLLPEHSAPCLHRMEQKTERRGVYAGSCHPQPQGIARNSAQDVRHQKGNLKKSPLCGYARNREGILLYAESYSSVCCAASIALNRSKKLCSTPSDL